jgi:hypothetical protein
MVTKCHGVKEKTQNESCSQLTFLDAPQYPKPFCYFRSVSTGTDPTCRSDTASLPAGSDTEKIDMGFCVHHHGTIFHDAAPNHRQHTAQTIINQMNFRIRRSVSVIWTCMAIICLPAAAASFAGESHPVGSHLHSSYSSWRGGAHLTNDEDIDKFINKLVAGVPDESNDAAKKDDAEVLDNNHDETAPEPENDAEETIVDADLDTKSDQDDEESEGEKSSSDNEEQSFEAEESSLKLNNPATETLQSTTIDTDTSVERTSTYLPRLPPNALYRFLLRRGKIGHILVMMIILLVEWTTLYVPALAHALGNVWNRFAPNPTEPRARKPPKLSKQERNRLTRHADKLALDVLKKLGTAHDAKYRYCGTGFLQRHQLGPYAVNADKERRRTAAIEALLGAEIQKKKRNERQRVVVVEESEDEYDDDVDWIVDALKPGETNKVSYAKQPSVSTVYDSRGSSVNVGIQFSFGNHDNNDNNSRRTSIEEIVKSKSRKVRKQYKSDRDSGFFGRIRDATGSNSFTKSLSGARPGDAMSLNEAASPDGLTNLAARYGYGQWSDDDENDAVTNNLDSVQRKRQKRRTSSTVHRERRKRRNNSSSAGIHFDFGFGGDQSSSKSSNDHSWRTPVSNFKQSPRTTTSLREEESKTSASSKKIEAPARSQGQKSTSIFRSALERTVMAMERTNKLFNEAKEREQSSFVRPAMSRSNELKEKSTLLREKSKPDEAVTNSESF